MGSVNGNGARPILAMVVEDEAIIRTFISFALRSLGCKVVAEMAYGEEAVEFAKNQDLDVVFMDIRLKGSMNGVDTAQHIAHVNSAHIVFMSAYDRNKIGIHDDFPNMLGYLVKPVHSADIQRIIATVSEGITSDADGA
ncbi:MAG: response regulator [Spirochaeta sp.]